MFCPNCGMQLNDGQRCPNCSPNNDNKKKTTLIIVLCVVIALLIGVVAGIIAMVSHGKNDSASSEMKDVRSSYAHFLNLEVLPVEGRLDNSSKDSTGVHSLMVKDYDKNGVEDAVVACRRRIENEMVYMLDVYTYENKKVQKKNSLELFSMQVSQKNNNQNVLVYTSDCKDSEYIICEDVVGDDDKHCVITILMYKDNVFAEIANIHIYKYGENGVIVFSTQLMDDWDIADSDFDWSKVDVKLDIEDVTVIYASDDNGYEYKKHYSSDNAAVEAFMKDFGVKTDGDLCGDNGNANKPNDDVDVMYEYSSGDAGITDHTDMDAFLEEYGKDNAQTTTQPLTEDVGQPSVEPDFELLKDMLSRSYMIARDYGSEEDSISYEACYDAIRPNYDGRSLYTYFYGDAVPDEMVDYDSKSMFDEQTFTLDANKVDWIMEHVFGKTGRKDIPGKCYFSNYFFECDYFGPEDGYYHPPKNPFYKIEILDKKYVGDDRYIIEIKQESYRSDMYDQCVYFVGKYVQDSNLKNGKKGYWTIEEFTDNSLVWYNGADWSVTKQDLSEEEAKKVYLNATSAANKYAYFVYYYQNQNDKFGEKVATDIPDCTSCDDMRNILHRTFTDSAIDDVMSEWNFVDHNGKIYAQTAATGYDSGEYIKVKKVSNTKFEITCIFYYENRSDETRRETHELIYDNGVWRVNNATYAGPLEIY